MRKILVTGAAALFTAVAIAASAVPASAGSFNLTLGLGGFGYGPGWGPGWYGPGYGGGIYIAQPYVGNSWQAHVDQCFALHPNTYNPNTNTYISNSGKVKICHTQFGY